VITASSVQPAISGSGGSTSYLQIVNAKLVNTSGVLAVTGTRVCLGSAVDWTFDLADPSPPTLTGNVTIGSQVSVPGNIIKCQSIGMM
jgi:hypothetical protein